MDTAPVSPADVESTRNIGARLRSEIANAATAMTQARAAAFMGTSPSTVSRIITERVDEVCHLAAAVGLQWAPLDAVVVSRADREALERMAYKYLQSRIEPARRGHR